MNGQIDGWTGKRKEREKDKWTNRQINVLRCTLTDKQTDGQTDRHVDRQSDR